MQSEISAYRARWVFPVIAPPIENGVVAVRDGKILEVTSKDRWNGPITHDLGDTAIIPGLVNAHTHLEFSRLKNPLGHRGIGFADWIELVIHHRRDHIGADERSHTVEGFRQCEKNGVVAIGEISTSFAVEEVSGPERIKTVAFCESIGLAEDQIEKRLNEFKFRHSHNHSLVQFGISPHAPYTVRWSLLDALIELATLNNTPVAMHIAESLEELELLANRTGPLREMLEKFGVWHDDAWPTVVSIADYLHVLATAPRSLIVHGNYLTTQNIELIAKHRERMSVVYCPRTHEYFEHSPHQYPEMIKKGINIALGTDSRASNPDLSLFEEMRTVAKQGRIAASEILKMGTINGSRALGLGEEFGSIKVGSNAHLCKIDGLDKSSTRDPHEILFAETSRCAPLADVAS